MRWEELSVGYGALLDMWYGGFGEGLSAKGGELCVAGSARGFAETAVWVAGAEGAGGEASPVLSSTDMEWNGRAGLGVHIETGVGLGGGGSRGQGVVSGLEQTR